MKKTVSLVLVLAMIAVVWTGFGAAASASEAQATNNTEKALALISTFATGDTDTARDLLADDYIQHNLAYGTGADAFIGSVEYLAYPYDSRNVFLSSIGCPNNPPMQNLYARCRSLSSKACDASCMIFSAV